MKLIIDVRREGYGIDQVRRTMTTGEIISYLEQYEEDTPVYIGHDNRYTFGGITENSFSEIEDEEEEEEYDD